jgi:hypothetical protein
VKCGLGLGLDVVTRCARGIAASFQRLRERCAVER